jgi:hypothetical protein
LIANSNSICSSAQQNRGEYGKAERRGGFGGRELGDHSVIE